MMNAVNALKGHKAQARLWFVMFILAVVGFSIERCHLVSRINAETQVLVVGEKTYYLDKLLDFTEAKQLHDEQATMAVETLFNRHPDGVDHPQRMKRLFAKSGHDKALKYLLTESDRFKEQQIHQKIEIEKISMLQVTDEKIEMSVSGQLIRFGSFSGRSFNEGLHLKVHLTFVRNKQISANGAYPTLVSSFQIQTTPIK